MYSNEYNIRKRKHMNDYNMTLLSYLKTLKNIIPIDKLNAINFIENIKQDLKKKYNNNDIYLLKSIRNLNNIQKVIYKNKSNNIQLLLKKYIKKLDKYENDDDYLPEDDYGENDDNPEDDAIDEVDDNVDDDTNDENNHGENKKKLMKIFFFNFQD